MNQRKQIEAALRNWLRSHYSVIGRREALVLGASRGTVETKLDRGEWVSMRRGVYRDSACAQGPYQVLRAACVATAGLGVISHVSAAWVWGLLPDPPTSPDLSVRAGTRDPRNRTGLTVHRSRDLNLANAVNWNNILVTNPLRTLVDVAGCVVPRDLTRAVDNALAIRLVSIAGLQAEIDRLARPGRAGVGPLRRHLLERGFIGAPEPSVLEAHARRLVVLCGLPLPTVELRVGEDGEYRLDIAWAGILLAIEVDGYAWHFSPEQLQRDSARRNQLQQAGWTLLVYTWHQVVNEPHRVAKEIVETYTRLFGNFHR